MNEPVRDDGPMARFEAVKADPGVPDMVFAKVCEGESLKAVAKEWAIPEGRFVQWFTTTHADLYDAALKVHAAELAMSVLAAADKGLDKDAVPAAKLYVDTRKWAAAKFDRARYGEQVKIEKDVNIGVDAGLIGFANALLEQMDTRPGVIAPRTLTVEPADDDEEGVI